MAKTTGRARGARGAGSIEKRRGRFFHVLWEIDDHGRRRRVDPPLGIYETREDAERARDLYALAGLRQESSGTVREWGDRWLLERRAKMGADDPALDDDERRRARVKFAGLRACWRMVEDAPWIDMPVADIETDHVMAWVEQVATTPITRGKTNVGQTPSRQTVVHGLNTLRRFYAWALSPRVRKELGSPCRINPAAGVKVDDCISDPSDRPRHEPAARFAVVPVDVIRRIIECPDMGVQRKAFFLTEVFSGIRPGHLLRVRWENVDLTSGKITVTDNRKASRAAGTAYTTTVLCYGLDALAAHWQAVGRPTSGYVFAKPDGRPYALAYRFDWDTRKERSRSVQAKRARKLAAGGMTQQAIADQLGLSRSRVQQFLRTNQKPGWGARMGTGEPLYSLKHTAASMLTIGDPLWVGEGGQRWTRDELQPQLGHATAAASARYVRTLANVGLSAGERVQANFAKRRRGRLRVISGG